MVLDAVRLRRWESLALSPATHPLVSVVIPCFNQACYLGEAIESALNQDYSDVEVVIVNDGSTDETAQIAAKNPAVRYVYQPNSGLASARNKGLASSHGSYVVFLDADDRLCPGALRAGVDHIASHPDSGFVYGRFRFIDQHGAEARVFDPPADNPDSYLGLFGGNHVAMCATVLYPRAVLESAGGFRAELRAAEDYDLYFRIGRLHPFTRHGALVAECRRHAFNMSLDAALMLRSTIEVVQSQRPYANTAPLREAYRRSLDTWRTYYGGMLARQIRTDLLGRHYRSAVNAVRVLVSFAPGVFIRSAVAFGRKLARPVKAKVSRALQPPSRRRLTPLSRDFAFDRGTPIDRYYIERFLHRHAADIQGHVLEVKDNGYTVRFGGERVSRSDVLDVDSENPQATVIADLNSPADIPSGRFDCVILTQTLQLVYDMRAAVLAMHRILKPGGVILVTMPGISQIARDQLDRWSDYWRVTSKGASRLFGDVFGEGNVAVDTFGNLSSACAFLQGKAAEELSAPELRVEDADYQLVITIRARKA
jgi:glycosyltransferase involved in cell wall biosynthesis